MTKRKILFLHGFFSSGLCPQAEALRSALEDVAQVLSPDLPVHPFEALSMVEDICRREVIDILVGNSCGSFYAQIAGSRLGIPSLLGNPYFRMTEFLEERIGEHRSKFPKRDASDTIMIDRSLIEEFSSLEAVQFDSYDPGMKEHILGIFGDEDPIAHFEPLFLRYYPRAYHFPGGHTPTPQQIRRYYVPLVERLLAMNHGYCRCRSGKYIE